MKPMTSNQDNPDDKIQAARQHLISHALYARLQTFDDARLFMQYHVFAVWDFFSLLKRLQREVSCVDLPWLPRGMGDHARFIHEIVIAEESDEGVDGGYLSHFELYLRAMNEIGADATCITKFRNELEAGKPIGVALVDSGAPDFIQDFVNGTVSLATNGAAHEVAASFCHGRENLLPDVLTGVRDSLGNELDQASVFRHYLDRHITLDHDEHGPLALRLLAALCEEDPAKGAEAEKVGVEAIEARTRLWDGILAQLDQAPLTA